MLIEESERRLRILSLDAEMVFEMLLHPGRYITHGIPADAEFRGASVDRHAMCIIGIKIRSDEFSPVPEMGEIPKIYGVIERIPEGGD